MSMSFLACLPAFIVILKHTIQDFKVLQGLIDRELCPTTWSHPGCYNGLYSELDSFFLCERVKVKWFFDVRHGSSKKMVIDNKKMGAAGMHVRFMVLLSGHDMCSEWHR